MLITPDRATQAARKNVLCRFSSSVLATSASESRLLWFGPPRLATSCRTGPTTLSCASSSRGGARPLPGQGQRHGWSPTANTSTAGQGPARPLLCSGSVVSLCVRVTGSLHAPARLLHLIVPTAALLSILS